MLTLESLKKFLRNLPHFKGKFRLVRFLYKNELSNSKEVVIDGKHGLQYLIPNLKESVGFRIFANGIYEAETSDLILKNIQKGTFLDIGANIGSVLFPVCRQNPAITGIGIEASPRVFSYLKKNKDLNKIHNCHIINKAIDHRGGDKVNFYSPLELFGKGSMAPIFTDVPEEVITITIDDLVREHGKINFIKIDIEGFEYFAFKGGNDLLAGNEAPDILFEFLDWGESLANGLQPGAAQKLLLDYGYDLYLVSKKYRLIAIQQVLEKGKAMLFASKKRNVQ